MAAFKKKPRPTKKPNILVIMGDDIGIHNISAYNLGICGWRTPNIDRIAQEGALFTDCYAQQSCTAGRTAFMMGQSPFRLGLLTIGMPGSPHGIPDWTPTLADLVKEQKGYRTAQFGKNHFGDMNSHLPTVHGFDQFYGNLYHLNAQEEPFTAHYPKEPEFRERFGPRGVLDCEALDRDPVGGDDPRFGPVGKQKITDTGQLDPKRMEDFDGKEIIPRAVDFIKDCVRRKDNFLMWVCPSRCHVWTHLNKEASGTTGCGVYADGMVEHDKHVGILLDTLKDQKIDEDTIVIYTTDNGAEAAMWPDGGITPFHGEKGTTWEGGFRCPMLVKWRGVFDAGVQINDMIALEDWLPTLMAGLGDDDVVERWKKGHKLGHRHETKIHFDGFNFLPYFLGDAEKSPREWFIYWSQQGNLNAVRYKEWKVSFAKLEGNIATGSRVVTSWPIVTNLRMDPYEVMAHESLAWGRWYGDLMWIFVPVGQIIKEFLDSLPGYGFQAGSTWGPADVNYNTVALKGAMAENQTFDATMFSNTRKLVDKLTTPQGLGHPFFD